MRIYRVLRSDIDDYSEDSFWITREAAEQRCKEINDQVHIETLERIAKVRLEGLGDLQKLWFRSFEDYEASQLKHEEEWYFHIDEIDVQE